jgi:hypothetical protein
LVISFSVACRPADDHDSGDAEKIREAADADAAVSRDLATQPALTLFSLIRICTKKTTRFTSYEHIMLKHHGT